MHSRSQMHVQDFMTSPQVSSAQQLSNWSEADLDWQLMLYVACQSRRDDLLNVMIKGGVNVNFQMPN